MNFHATVLLNEVVNGLNLKPGNIVVDGTLGGGGHSLVIAKEIGAKGKLVAIDLDPAALKEAKDKLRREKIKAKVIFVQDNYANIKSILDANQIHSVDAILVDLGISGFDLDQSKRGFSFQKDEPLDMRFDPTSSEANRNREPLTARFIVNRYDLKQLEKIFKNFGEEKFSRNIARAIVARRQTNTIERTTDLFEIIKTALPKNIRHKAADSARRIFQALRIETNKELQNVEKFLPNAFAKLKRSGRLAVISFHSLEDRIAKHYFLELAKGCVCPPDFPKCVCGKTPLAKILTKKPITAAAKEQALNPRSRPAKLRIIEKI